MRLINVWMYPQLLKNCQVHSSVDKYQPADTISIVKHLESVLVGGCFCVIGGISELYFLTKNITIKADCYISFVENHLHFFYMIVHCVTRQWVNCMCLWRNTCSPAIPSPSNASGLPSRTCGWRILVWFLRN